MIEIADSYIKLGNIESAEETLTRFSRLGGKNANVSEMLRSLKKEPPHDPRIRLSSR